MLAVPGGRSAPAPGLGESSQLARQLFVAERRRDQLVDAPAERLFRRPPEHPLRSPVPGGEHELGVRRENGVVHVLEQACVEAELLLGPLALGDVAVDAEVAGDLPAWVPDRDASRLDRDS